MPLKTRFAAKAIIRTSGCIEWSGYRTKDGYGRCWAGRRMIEAHRVSYQLFIGPISPGHVVMHTCDNPPCVAPAHLKAARQADNVADMIAKGRDRKRGVRGEANKRAKLTAAQVRDIRTRHSTGGVQLKELGAEFGVSPRAISMIVRNINWKDI